jgi:tocopherol O-methyltransferase
MAAITEKIKEHYDAVSLYYQQLWGIHIHHGYWKTGNESREQATENLIQLLVDKACVPVGAHVLDVGCGVGGTALWLAKHRTCSVTGITISTVQVDMAKNNTRDCTPKPTFLVMDANTLQLTQEYRSIFAIEMISHLSRRKEFFAKVARALDAGGTLCLADWVKDTHLTSQQNAQYIDPIEKGMLVRLSTCAEYVRLLESNRFRILYCEDLSKHVAKTWDIGLEIIAQKTFWKLATKKGTDFVSFLRAFRAMQKGYASGAFRYVAIVAEKC